jgi:hypothetical protein
LWILYVAGTNIPKHGSGRFSYAISAVNYNKRPLEGGRYRQVVVNDGTSSLKMVLEINLQKTYRKLEFL